MSCPGLWCALTTRAKTRFGCSFSAYSQTTGAKKRGNPVADEKTDGVTFRVPTHVLLYLALGLSGGGAIWNKLEGIGLAERSERTDRALYETLAGKLEEALSRTASCEERLDALERAKSGSNGSGDGSGGLPSRGDRRGADVGPLGPSLPPAGLASPDPEGSFSGLPRYEDVQRIASELYPGD